MTTNKEVRDRLNGIKHTAEYERDNLDIISSGDIIYDTLNMISELAQIMIDDLERRDP